MLCLAGFRVGDNALFTAWRRNAARHLRRVRPAQAGEVLEWQDIRLDPETHRVTRAGAGLKLGPTEFRLLSCLMERPGRVFSREQLLDRV